MRRGVGSRTSSPLLPAQLKRVVVTAPAFCNTIHNSSQIFTASSQHRRSFHFASRMAWSIVDPTQPWAAAAWRWAAGAGSPARQLLARWGEAGAHIRFLQMCGTSGERRRVVWACGSAGRRNHRRRTSHATPRRWVARLLLYIRLQTRRGGWLLRVCFAGPPFLACRDERGGIPMSDYISARPQVVGLPYAYALAFAFGFALTLLALQAANDETLKP